MKNLFVLFLTISFFSIHSLNAQSAVTVAEKLEGSSNVKLLKWDQTTFQFGDIQQGNPSDATFTVTNHSDQPLILKEVKPTCGCTVANYTQDPILPGASTTIKATYNAKKEGVFQKTIKVYTNLDEAYIPLKLKGKVVAGKL